MGRHHTGRAVSGSFRETVALPVIEQMQELQAALSLNKAQLAGILRVTRPTLYDWLRGREPNAANAGRVDTLLRILARASVSSASPLNARFVARSLEIDAPLAHRAVVGVVGVSSSKITQSASNRWSICTGRMPAACTAKSARSICSCDLTNTPIACGA